MKTQKKQLLGFVGLAAVMLMTVAAHNIPAPSAYAVSSDVNVKVTVYGQNTETKIQSPLDGATVTSSNLTVVNMFSEASRVEYTLTHGGNTYNLPPFVSGSGNASETHTFTVDLSTYAGYGDYILRAVATSTNGAISEDAVSFTYSPIAITENENKADNYDPIIDLDYDTGVRKVKFQAIDKKTNKPLFEPEFVYTVSDPSQPGSAKVTLPFAEYGATPDDYYIVATAFGQNNNQPLANSVSLKIVYSTPDAPAVPDTGGLTIAGLTLSRADYLITALVVFGLTALLGLYFIHKKKSARK